VWRSNPNEEGGAAIRICNTLGVDGTFNDYNVASGELYTYFVDAVDGAGVTARSASASSSVQLASTRLHATTKQVSTSNLQSSGLALRELIPWERAPEIASESFLMGGATTPEVHTGVIEQEIISFLNRIPVGQTAERALLKSLFELGAFMCLRDTFGNKFFGSLAGYTEAYSHTWLDVPIVFQVLDYKESVG